MEPASIRVVGAYRAERADLVDGDAMTDDYFKHMEYAASISFTLSMGDVVEQVTGRNPAGRSSFAGLKVLMERAQATQEKLAFKALTNG